MMMILLLFLQKQNLDIRIGPESVLAAHARSLPAAGSRCPAGADSAPHSEQNFLPTVRVGHAWTLGLVRRPVVLSGMRRWPSEALHGCCVENGFIMETLSGAYSQGSQELSASAGAY